MEIVVVYIRMMSIGNEKQCCSFRLLQRGLKAAEGNSSLVCAHMQREMSNKVLR